MSGIWDNDEGRRHVKRSCDKSCDERKFFEFETREALYGRHVNWALRSIRHPFSI